MTETQEKLLEKLERYFKNKNRYNYIAVVSQMRQDLKFEKYIQSISIDKLGNGKTFDKNKYRFTYMPKEW